MSDWEQVFGDLVAARGPALTRYAYLLSGSSADAADLVQEALVRAFGRTSRGLSIDSAEAYVRRAILTTFIDGRRRGQRWRAVRHLFTGREAADGPESAIVGADEMATALAALSPRQRACVVLRYYEDLPIAGIADALGCSVGTVKRHLSDALTRMAPHVADPTEGRLP